MNGIAAEAVGDSTDEAAERLCAKAIRIYPVNDFARRHPRLRAMIDAD